MDQQTRNYLERLSEKLDQKCPMNPERRELYEEFLKFWPTAFSRWIDYIREEIEINNVESVQKLFNRCLPKVPNVKLFVEYINFVKSQHSDPSVICASYDYAISQIGLDMDALEIYESYIDYIESVPDNQISMDVPRNVFHLALDVPMHNLPNFQQRYHKFEETKNAQGANALLKVWDQRAKESKSAYFQKKSRHKLLRYNLLEQNNSYFDLLHRWRIYLDFELQNPLKLKPDRHQAFVIYAYRCALIPLRYSWLIWHDYCQFLISCGDDNSALEAYKEAISVLPHNLLLNFSYAELLESRKRSTEAHAVYQRVLETTSKIDERTLSMIQFLKFVQRTEGPNSMRQQFIKFVDQTEYTYHLFLAIASIENSVNLNVDASKRILMECFSRNQNDEACLEEIVKLLIHIGANNELALVMNHAKSVMSQEKRLTLCWTLLDHLRCIPESETIMLNIESDILEMSPNITREQMNLYNFFLPIDMSKPK